ncbi:glycoside hydrolase family 19 protein [Sphingomonas canadensis]|uniref:Glycoside hydrolase family 19 protein n=1 Tax=Sphingomonas canadensis TaxID=1219257 RepID=A0ABW3H6C6_9SPHN|nr:glycoside hydrolase family 19 protein [Sphingomonas canadensis]MCW3836370.1 hypothetical protein [Sphingomonas canadensis]
MENAKRAQQRLISRGYALTADGDFGARSFAALMGWIAGKKPVTPMRGDLGAAAASHFGGVGITSALRTAHALAQQCVETGGFALMVESFNYTVAGLRSTFPRSRISDADCQRLGRKAGDPPLDAATQAEIANLVYGGAWGTANLGNSQPGDGWRYRGRGAKQVTGRANYADAAQVTGVDLINDPDLLADTDVGMRAACAFWDRRKCNPIADADDIERLTRTINGGTNGLAARKAALALAKEILL